MHIFYTPHLRGEHTSYSLSEEESKHCIKVLRLTKGAEVVLVDGCGGWFNAEVVEPHPNKTVLKILSLTPSFGRRNHRLHLAVAPTKNIERFEWFLEKATEIGIDEITPILCEHSERKVVKIERLNKRITAAMKQSLKAYHPRLNPILSMDSFIKQSHQGQRFIAHCMEGDKYLLSEVLTPHSSYTLLIGPEGDFSPVEVDRALRSGFIPIGLGKSRLRTETAALASCFEVNYLNRS